jgi:hypothetical protein
VDQRGNDLDTLLIPLGERIDAVVRPVGEAHPAQPLECAPLRFLPLEAAQATEVHERAQHRDVAVQPTVLREVRAR